MPITISKQLIHKILTEFGLAQQISKIASAQSGYRNTVIPMILKNGQNLSLIFYKREPGIVKKIQRANYVSSELAKKDWPTRRAITNQNGQSVIQLAVNHKIQYCCIYNYLPGHTISWSDYSQKHLKLLGQVLGYLHHDLATIKPFVKNSKFLETMVLRENLIEMNNYFCSKNIQVALKKKLNITLSSRRWQQWENLLIALEKIRPIQFLHLDFVRGNILFEKLPSHSSLQTPMVNKLNFDLDQTSKSTPSITGILDWEKTALGAPVIDVARTLAFLIIDCRYKPENKVKKYFLNSGYEKRGQQTLRYKQLLDPLIEFFLCYDFYKFLKHNPYEFLPQNEHFIRTATWLKQHQLLLPIQ